MFKSILRRFEKKITKIKEGGGLSEAISSKLPIIAVINAIESISMFLRIGMSSLALIN